MHQMTGSNDCSTRPLQHTRPNLTPHLHTLGQMPATCSVIQCTATVSSRTKNNTHIRTHTYTYTHTHTHTHVPATASPPRLCPGGPARTGSPWTCPPPPPAFHPCAKHTHKHNAIVVRSLPTSLSCEVYVLWISEEACCINDHR
jgi:hypothetical protein